MSRVCSICGGTSHGHNLCDPCAGLLRWVKGYFDFDKNLHGYITPETHFINDLAFDSLDWMFWPLEAEEKLGVRLSNQQYEKIFTVGQYIRMLREYGAEWPDDQDLRLQPRRWWCSPYAWDVIEREDTAGASGSNLV